MYTFEDKINIYEKPTTHLGVQGYVAWESNKGHNQTGKGWSNNGNIVNVENKGFKLSFHRSASNSSQGGDLSFWNCVLSKDDKSWTIGVNSHSLLELLKECTCVNGEVQEHVIFARFSGQVVCIKENGVHHTKLLEALQRKHEEKQAKAKLKMTTKHIIGGVYSTKSNIGSLYRTHEVYLGEWYVVGKTKGNWGRGVTFKIFSSEEESLEYLDTSRGWVPLGKRYIYAYRCNNLGILSKDILYTWSSDNREEATILLKNKAPSRVFLEQLDIDTTKEQLCKTIEECGRAY